MRNLPHGVLALALAAGPALAQAPAEGAQPPAEAPPAAPEAKPAAPEAKPAAPEQQLTAQEQAAVYFQEGRAAFRDKDYRSAADKFQAAYNLDPVPILLYNMARAAEEMGDPQKAIGHYESYLARLGPQAEDRDEVERRIRVMEKTIAAARRARIRIAGLPPKAAITVDGQPAIYEDGLVRAEPGERVLRVVPTDGKPWTRKLGLSTGEYVELAFGEAEKPVTPPDEGLSPMAIAGWSAVGAGALFTVLGVVFYSDASDAHDDWQKTVDLIEVTSDPQTRAVLIDDKAEAAENFDSSKTATYVLWGLGGAALAAGGALLYLEYVHDGGADTSASLVPLPGGVGITGRF